MNGLILSGFHTTRINIRKGNNYDKLQLGRCVVQYHTNGEIGVTGFFDKGKYSANGRDISEALQWTPLYKTSDNR